MMSARNKLLSVILMFAVLLSTALPTCAETKNKFEPGEHRDTITFLINLGLMDDDFVAADAPVTVTRAEFAKLVANVMLMAGSSTIKTSFTDVAPENEYAPYIYSICQAGYMNGISKTEFGPNETLHFEEAVSVCVRIAGYGQRAEATGGYPQGYILQASTLKLFKNTTLAQGFPASRGNVIELIYNTVMCDMMTVSGVGSSTSYSVHEGENILSYYHGIYEEIGIVTADNIYTMTKQRSKNKDMIIIDNVSYHKKDSSVLENTVGRCVKFWYDESNETKTILYGEKYNISEIVFGAGDDLEFDTDRGQYTYNKNKTLHYKLALQYDVIYNMEELYPVTSDKLLPATGTVTLIDNNSDKLYDVVIIDEFYNLVVDVYNENLNTISDIKDPSRTIQLDNFDDYRVIERSGNPVKLSQIKTYNVLEIYESVDKAYLVAVVNTNVVSGVFNEKSDDKIYIDSVPYSLSSDLRSDYSSLILGNEYNFFVNTKNEIVYWSGNFGYKQGYILGVAESTGLDSQISVKLLSQMGKVEVYPLASKVKNVFYGSSTSIEEEKWQSIFGEINTREFVLYQLNDRGELSAVVHAMEIHDRSTFNNTPSYPLFRLDFFAEQWREEDGFVYGGELYFRGGINGFDNMLVFTDDAKLYRVPSVSNSTVDDDSVSVTPLKLTLFTDYTIKFTDSYCGDGGTMITYMVGDCYPYANVMVEHAGGSGTTIVLDQMSTTVTDIRHTYDLVSQENKTFLDVWNGKNIVSVGVNDESILTKEKFSQTVINGASPTIPESKTKIEIGDIIKYTTDEAGNVNGVALMYDRNSDSLCYNTKGFGKAYNLSAGTVSGVYRNAIEVSIPLANSKNRCEIYDVSSLPTLIVDQKRNKCYIGSPLDIELGDDILRYSRYSDNKNITIYKN